MLQSAPVMPLVEIIPGAQTASRGLQRGDCGRLRKVTVLDSPGFIVNRGRPFMASHWILKKDRRRSTIDWGCASWRAFEWAVLLMDLSATT
jgi:3-hydroxyacyl-CoA dehydrogenase